MTDAKTQQFHTEFDKIVAETGGFSPSAYYDPDGDCIEFVASDEPFYAERIDRFVTVYYGQESKKIVGSLIKDVSKLCAAVLSKFPGFKIAVRDGRILLEHIFQVQLWSSNPDEKLPVVVYQRLIALARETAAEAQGLACCK